MSLPEPVANCLKFRMNRDLNDDCCRPLRKHLQLNTFCVLSNQLPVESGFSTVSRIAERHMKPTTKASRHRLAFNRLRETHTVTGTFYSSGFNSLVKRLTGHRVTKDSIRGELFCAVSHLRDVTPFWNKPVIQEEPAFTPARKALLEEKSARPARRKLIDPIAEARKLVVPYATSSSAVQSQGAFVVSIIK